MKNSKSLFTALAALSILAASLLLFPACSDDQADQTDPALNGTWVGTNNNWIFNNGDYIFNEKANGELELAHKGTYTTSNGKITMTIKFINGAHYGGSVFPSFEAKLYTYEETPKEFQDWALSPGTYDYSLEEMEDGYVVFALWTSTWYKEN